MSRLSPHTYQPLLPPSGPIDYVALSDAAYAQQISKMAVTFIFLPWLCYRIYHSRLFCATPATTPRTFYTAELGQMLATITGWSAGSMVAVALRETPMYRRLYLFMTLLVPLLTRFADAATSPPDDEVGYVMRIVVSIFVGALTATCFV